MKALELIKDTVLPKNNLSTLRYHSLYEVLSSKIFIEINRNDYEFYLSISSNGYSHKNIPYHLLTKEGLL